MSVTVNDNNKCNDSSNVGTVGKLTSNNDNDNNTSNDMGTSKSNFLCISSIRIIRLSSVTSTIMKMMEIKKESK